MKLAIGPRTYTVQRASPEWRHRWAETLGTCEQDHGVITIDDGYPSDKEASTLLHEVIHAIWDAYRLPAEVSEEEACRRLEGPLLAFMADNPQVVGRLIAARGGVRLNIGSQENP